MTRTTGIAGAAVWLWGLAAAVIAAAPAGADAPPAPVRWGPGGAGGSPEFGRHVLPLLSKLGCSGRSCHGSFQGRGGLRLSLFASDPRQDRANLTAEGRVNVAAPRASRLLRKPAGEAPHGGGKRFAQGGWEYRLLERWIAAGARGDGAETRPRNVEGSPAELLLPSGGGRVRIRARFADGTVEEVTALTQLTSNDEGVARVAADGAVTRTGSGDTHLVAVYGGSVTSVPVLAPFPNPAAQRQEFPARNYVDLLVAARLRKLGIAAAARCADEEFLRRASLDITGTLPLPDEVLAFHADPAPAKRERKIDELLERPAYSVWWTTLLCDLLGLNAPLYLGNTDYGPHMGSQWHRWLQRRVRENVGWDRIAAGLLLGSSRQPGEDYDSYATRASSYMRAKGAPDITELETIPHYWFRENLKEPEERALSIAYIFMGVKLDCAQCHKHPFDIWTQQDFQQFAALLAPIRRGIAPESTEAHARLRERLGVKRMTTAAERRQTFWRLAAAGETTPWYEIYVSRSEGKPSGTARILGGPEVDLTREPDPRAPLTAWLCGPDNPYFARAFVNRIWAHYFGQGLVEPSDDHSLANPPRNRELLEYLARRFAASGFDMKALHREIVRSGTYQLSWRPGPGGGADTRNHSRVAIRRLPAEVVIDAVFRATSGPGALAAAADPTSRRIGAQATADELRTEYGLVVFGKPLRRVGCDCERQQEPSLLQALYLRNDDDLNRALDRKDGWLADPSAPSGPEAWVREAYLRTLSRLPEPAEAGRAQAHLTRAADPAAARRDLLWALLNTREFVTNH